MKIIIYYLLAINIITFFIFLIDKVKSIKGSFRISEKDLILFSLVGGSIGALLSMYLFHHKTLKQKFRLGIPIILILQIIIIFLLIKNHYIM